MNLKYYLKKAQKEKWAIGQFNFSNLEILRAAVLAAKEMRAPIILGTSEGESRFFGLKEAVAVVRILRNIWPPIFLNLDHGKLFDYIKKAINIGYDDVHFDGSKLPLNENIKIAKRVVKYARRKGVLIEGEVGYIKGASKILEKMPEIGEQDLTDPEEAQLFSQKTDIDSLAINIGTFHGVDASGKKPHINFQRLKELKERVGSKFLVLHGGSGVPGGDIKKAIKNGIVKININTELRIIYTTALKKVLKENPKEITPYKIMPEVIRAVQKKIEQKIKLFGSINKA